MTRGIWKIVLLVAGSLALGGCGGGSSSSTKSNGTTERQTATIVENVRVVKTFVFHESEFRIAPRRIRIERFGYYGIKAVNDGAVTHALELEGPGTKHRTADLAPGASETFAIFFKRAGTYRLYCPIDGHEQQGMKATIRVH